MSRISSRTFPEIPSCNSLNRSAERRWFCSGGGFQNFHLVVFVVSVVLMVSWKYPVLPFLVFLEKGKENHQKSQGFFIPTEPLKSLEKERKTLKKQGIPRREKKQGIPKNNEKEGQGEFAVF